ncbi:glycosyltransferase [Castellaniella sp.]|uniref:glycosyltransferase n=1 Tax=Castellaniella sp. TaxID=1955812 RepID=UPI002AFE8375|nr:glycosyltransferase [Castellaniella sp.]
MTVKLLRRGNLALLHEPYSAFRVSKEQFSQQGRDQPGIGEKGHNDFRRMIRELGWYRAKDNHLVRVRPLNDKTRGFAPLDLAERIRSRQQRLLQTLNQKESWSVPDWIADRTPSSSRVLALRTMLQANPDVGTLGVAVIVSDTNALQPLVDTLESLGVQHRPVDGVWLIGDGIPSTAAGNGIEIVSGSGGWPKRLSDRIAQGNAPDFLWVLHAGDRLVPHATLLMGEYRLRSPNPLVWYADEAVLIDKLPANPMLKPDFNVDLLRSYPYVGRNLIISTAAVQAVGGLQDQLADLAPVDLLWRMVEQVGPPVVGHIPEVLLYGAVSLLDWVESAQAMLWSPVATQTHLVRMGSQATVETTAHQGVCRVAYPLPAQPLVSIIIPTRDQLPVLRACVEGLMERTTYPHYELLIVDNDSRDPEALQFLAQLESLASEQIRILRWPQAFDFSAINNFAVQQARGDVFLFLNNDISFTDQTRPDWLQRLLSLALRPEVGAAGPRLDLADGKVDQNGLVLGLNGGVGGAFRGQPVGRRGYMNRLVAQQNVSALSASCLMMRRDVFQELGGFDAKNFPIDYGDADLCMKATQAGYLLALEPDISLRHMGGATRLLTKKFGIESQPGAAERDQLFARWLPQLAQDPNYHPAFGKFAPGFDLSRDAARIQTPLPGRPLPVVMAMHADWEGCGHYRILHPFRALSDELRLDGSLKIGNYYFGDVARIQPDVIVLQGAWIVNGILEEIRRYRDLTGAKVVLEFDDYLPNIPTRSVYRQRMPQSEIKKMRRAIEEVDWLVVSTPVLAEEYRAYHADIRVAHNGLPRAIWGDLSGQRQAGRKPRVGWAGGISHTGDLAEIRAVVQDLQGEVEWVFMGMKPDGVACEYHASVDINRYPAKLASLNLDLAVVPLEDNQFNRCKSNLRLLEFGACGVPVIATDIDPYRTGLPVTLVRNRPRDWVQSIRSHLSDMDALARQGDALRQAVLTGWMLEDAFLDQWAHAWGMAPAGA